MGLLVLRVVPKQILSDVVDRVLRLDLLLSKCGQRLQNQRHHGLVQIRSDGKRLKTVFSGLNITSIT
jgi:hypothetical protein